eukprot:10885897-Prorocentrum_lima.AAC.1
MTSSLVGSEMCIRDRHSTALVAVPPGPVHQGNAPSSHCQPCAFCQYPVSYTHLTLPTICSV